jgi:broad specificity phosphatase PhoE
MYLFLVRHGQSVWNAEERHQGWQDVALSPFGEQQAGRIGQRLKDQHFDYYFTSPIYRCYQTAAIIVNAQGLEPESTLQKLEGIKEGRLSARMEGMLTKDMVKTWTKEQKERFRDDYTFKFDDGESVKEIMERTLAAFHQIAMFSEEAPPEPAEEAEEESARNRDRSATPTSDTAAPPESSPQPEKPKIVPKTALVVAHQINIQFFILQTLGATDTVVRRQTNIDRLAIANCALSVVEVNLKGKEPHYRLISSNDASHLAGLQPPPKS